MADLIKETYLPVIQEQFVEDTTWVADLPDMSGSVDGIIVNIPNAGPLPDVFVDNSVWPMPVTSITDSNIQITLKRFDSSPTVVHNHQKKAYAYDKVASDTLSHVQQVQRRMAQLGAYNLSPAAAAAGVFKIKTSGAMDGARQRLSYTDIVNLRRQMNNAGIPEDGRHLVLSGDHESDLLLEDKAFFNQKASHDKGTFVTEFYGFKVRTYSNGAVYASATGAKQTFNAPEAAGFYKATFSYQRDCVFKAWSAAAIGTEPSVLYGGTLMSVNRYGIILPKRPVGINVIYS